MESKDKRRANWLLIKQAWNWENKAGEFNEALGVNNNVYYDIQKGRAIDSRLLKRVSEKTGISEKIITGQDLLYVEETDEKRWENYIRSLDQLYDKKKHMLNKDEVKKRLGVNANVVG